jgi:hypothetical protein
VDKKTVRRLIETGRLRAIDFGSGRRHHYRIDPDDLRTVATAFSNAPTTSPTCRRPRRRVASSNSADAYLPSV